MAKLPDSCSSTPRNMSTCSPVIRPLRNNTARFSALTTRSILQLISSIPYVPEPASLSSALSRTTDEATCSSFIVRKGLSHEFFTFVPLRLRSRRIECISAYSFARRADDHVVRHDIADVAVLAISAHTEVAAP